MAEQPAQTTATKQLLLQKIYVKDLSFESPKAPAIFNANVTPQTQLNMRSSSREVAPSVQEVTLTLTVEAKDGDSTLFLVEIAQAGIFTMQGYNDQERAMLIGSYCPGALYPYAREAISDVVVKGGFPQLLLQPINFDALYAQALQQRAQQAGQQPSQWAGPHLAGGNSQPDPFAAGAGAAARPTAEPQNGGQAPPAGGGDGPAETKADETH